MLIISNIGDQVWLMTSRQTEPDLSGLVFDVLGGGKTYNSSMLGWKMRLTKPMLGDLYGY